jgi:hypothetical protein
MNKAVHKKREHDKKKIAREEEKARDEAGKKPNGTAPVLPSGSPDADLDEEEDMDIEMSDDEDNTTSELASIKRKRDGETPATPLDDEDATAGANKRLKTEEEATPPPPPPPPPPPAEDDYAMDESATPTQEPSPVESEERVYEKEVPSANGNRSPVQLATPSTNGSYEQELKIKGQSKITAGGE